MEHLQVMLEMYEKELGPESKKVVNQKGMLEDFVNSLKLTQM